VPALNIILLYLIISIPDILASLKATSTSSLVDVGDLKNRVSDIIAEHNSPAVLEDISIPSSKNILATIVDVLPIGLLLKSTG
jgi:hypothetical protein